MAYQIVLPDDTAIQIDGFINEHCASHADVMATADLLDSEMKKLATNPTLGAQQVGTPFGARRVHRFTIIAGETHRTVEFMYAVNQKRECIVFSGFEEVRIGL